MFTSDTGNTTALHVHKYHLSLETPSSRHLTYPRSARYPINYPLFVYLNSTLQSAQNFSALWFQTLLTSVSLRSTCSATNSIMSTTPACPPLSPRDPLRPRSMPNSAMSMTSSSSSSSFFSQALPSLVLVRRKCQAGSTLLPLSASTPVTSGTASFPSSAAASPSLSSPLSSFFGNGSANKEKSVGKQGNTFDKLISKMQGEERLRQD
ncbi:hypothetical protein V1508DRAFT_263815 [Lipomyces doorenjongii]|uniref:uncharacterized protein n=1 Tax=Lipomyces doorenjongii TaxID=383834 RepID=UPI0034CDF02D